MSGIKLLDPVQLLREKMRSSILSGSVVSYRVVGILNSIMPNIFNLLNCPRRCVIQLKRPRINYNLSAFCLPLNSCELEEYG